MHITKWLLCNSSHELELSGFCIFTSSKNHSNKTFSCNNQLDYSKGNLWPHDQTCLKCQDHQSPCSVYTISRTMLRSAAFQ